MIISTYIYIIFIGHYNNILEGHNLLPFGNSTGDHVVQRVDDGFSDPLILNQPFIFFGRSYNQVIVSALI